LPAGSWHQRDAHRLDVGELTDFVLIEPAEEMRTQRGNRLVLPETPRSSSVA
jgi:hypothetical protein